MVSWSQNMSILTNILDHENTTANALTRECIFVLVLFTNQEHSRVEIQYIDYIGRHYGQLPYFFPATIVVVNA